MTPTYYSIRDIAREFRFSQRTIRKVVVQQGFPAPVTPHPQTWEADKVIAWAESRKHYGPPPIERTALYRHFDAEGRLLYVGIARDHLKRLYDHTATSPWRDLIARIEVEWHDSREAALRAELTAIVTESPEYNIAGKPQ